MDAEALQPTPQVLGAILRGEQVPADTDTGPEDDEERTEDAETRRPESSEASERQPVESDEDDDQADSEAGGEDSEAEASAESEATEDRIQLRELAEQLGTTSRELYDRLMVPLPDNRGDVPLTELKRAYVDTARHEDRVAELEEERARFQIQRDDSELATLRDRQDLQRLLPHVRTLPQELVAQAEQQALQERRTERQRLVDARPEWRDQAKMDEARNRLQERAVAHGFSPAEFSAVYDHRLLLVLDRLDTLERERVQMVERLRDARTRKGEPRSKGRRSTGKTRRTTRAARPATNQDAARQVASLLNRGLQGDNR